MLEIDFPPDIDTDNARAWYLKTHFGLTYEEIGKELHYTPQGAHQLIVRGFKQRVHVPKLYEAIRDFCRQECDGRGCTDCMLSKFIVQKLLRRKI